MTEHERRDEGLRGASSPAAELGALPAGGVVDSEWLAKHFAALAETDQIGMLVMLTSPQTVDALAAELEIPRATAEERLARLAQAGLVEAIPGPTEEHVVNLRTLFALFEEFEKLGAMRPEEHDDVLEQTMGVPVRGAIGPESRGAGLLVVRGLGWGRRHPLERRSGRSWIVGRDARTDLPVEYDVHASKQHAEIRFDGDSFRLRDLGSTNGTLLNLGPVGPEGETQLQHGDVIGVGRTLFLFWDRPMTPRR